MSELVFPQPLSLSIGSHPAGSGFGCAMNVVSWEQGTRITDYPECAASPLARLVQGVNDIYCGHLQPAHSENGYAATVLCPPCSLDVLDLAHRTVGTAGATLGELWLWMADLLVGKHGVVHHLADGEAIAYTEHVARVAERRAAGEADDGTYSRPALTATGFASGTQRRALRVATTVLGSSPILDFIVFDGMDVPRPVREAFSAQHVLSVAKTVGHQYATVTENVEGAACCGEKLKNPEAILEAAHHAIDSWERVTGVTAPQVVDADVVAAVNKMLVATWA